MEREILIANTKTQKRSKITTSATTLGELKADLRAAGIDYSGMTFTEGISKTQLLDDATQLPQNVMYKGQPTNNLVILLTNTKKNISSGAISRQEIKNIIKRNNLQEAIKNKFGRNYTQVSNKDLELFIDSGKWCEQKKKTEAPKAENVGDEEKSTVSSDESTDDRNLMTAIKIMSVEDSLFTHIGILADQGILTIPDLQKLESDIHELIKVEKGEKSDRYIPIEDIKKPVTLNYDDVDDIIDDLDL